ncbi:MAG: hypothetical protein KDD13_00355 [Mangrovimonas sp.]|nr:hypothetical protein [Mangrovimonas sp.]
MPKTSTYPGGGKGNGGVGVPLANVTVYKRVVRPPGLGNLNILAQHGNVSGSGLGDTIMTINGVNIIKPTDLLTIDFFINATFSGSPTQYLGIQFNNDIPVFIYMAESSNTLHRSTTRTAVQWGLSPGNYNIKLLGAQDGGIWTVSVNSNQSVSEFNCLIHRG